MNDHLTPDPPRAAPALLEAAPATGASASSEVADQLSADLFRKNAKQLQHMALTFGMVFLLASVPGLIRVATGAEAMSTRIAISWTVSLMTALGSLGFWITIRRGQWPLEKIPDLSLAFGVFGSFAIAFVEQWGRLVQLEQSPDISWVGGISWICVWLTAFAIIVPAPAAKVKKMVFIAASMMPLVLALDWLVSGVSAAGHWQLLFSFVWPPYVAAGIASLGASLASGLRKDLIVARQMGSYSLTERIGAGGMGEVWRAEHSLLARPAAVKLIHPERLERAASNPGTVLKRFEREARATAGLRSAHTIEVYDFGITAEGTFYYVMELLEGMNLDELVQRFGPQRPERVVHILAQVCRSLDDAHGHGLVHRDIKPANIFLCCLGGQDDFVKVLDFGLVKLRGESESKPAEAEADQGRGDGKLTRAGSLMGTPAYMAPELATGDAGQDGRLDLYAVGCVAYWLLTGRDVFQASGPMQLALKHVNEVPDPVSEHAPHRVPAELEALVMRCLAKSPGDRPASASVMLGTLSGMTWDEPWDDARAAFWWASVNADSSAQPDRGATPSTLAGGALVAPTEAGEANVAHDSAGVAGESWGAETLSADLPAVDPAVLETDDFKRS